MPCETDKHIAQVGECALLRAVNITRAGAFMEWREGQDLLVPIDELLELQLGDTTVGRIMRTWRDKGLVHQTFTFKPIQKNVYSKVDLLDPETGELYSGIVTELFRRARDLYVRFVARYAEALEA